MSGENTDAMDAEIMWLRSSLVSLLVLAEAHASPLTNEQVATICKVALSKFDHPPMSGCAKATLI